MRKIQVLGMRVLVAVTLLAVAGSVGGQVRSTSDTARRFIGTWRLVSVTGSAAEQQANRGPHPTGVIYYDGTGQMAVQIMPDRARPKWTGAPIGGNPTA